MLEKSFNKLIFALRLNNFFFLIGESFARSISKAKPLVQEGLQTGVYWPKAPVLYLRMYHCQGEGSPPQASLWWLVWELWLLDKRGFTPHLPHALVREELPSFTPSKKWVLSVCLGNKPLCLRQCPWNPNISRFVLANQKEHEQSESFRQNARLLIQDSTWSPQNVTYLGQIKIHQSFPWHIKNLRQLKKNTKNVPVESA